LKSPFKSVGNWVMKRMASSDIFRSSMQDYGIKMFSRHGYAPDVSMDALVKKYMGWVYTCTHINATAVASTPLRLYATRATGQSRSKATAIPVKKDKLHYLQNKESLQNMARIKTAEEIEEVVEHPLLTLLQQVNEYDNGFETLELTSTLLDLTGNSYWFLEFGTFGIPKSIWFLRSQWVAIVPDKKKFIKGYIYGISADRKIALDANEVIHFKYPNPKNPWYGAGPVEAASYAIERQNQMDRYEASTLKNMGRPDLGIIYKGGQLDPERRKELEIEWNNSFRGPDKGGKIKVLDQDFGIEKFGWSPKEMEFLQGRPWTMKEIASAMNVPIGFLDTSEISKAPRAGMEGTDLFLSKYSTRPRCTRIEQKLNEKLTPLYDERLFLAFDNPVPEDRRFNLLDESQQIKNFTMTINEVRASRNLASVTWGDVPLAPQNILPLGSASEDNQEGLGQRQPKTSKKNQLILVPDDGLSGGSSFIDGKELHPDLVGVEVEVDSCWQKGRQT